uniref:Uncharacterized protein n=1 Tax=Candidatus Kentrum sp. FW TaxID=2126338 RepID=A0A450TBI9_9GAMM|nr:MAG: hypothetical protein BECKFW1821A_GA0114235_11654 [Candidatus Kentron sp. FW]
MSGIFDTIGGKNGSLRGGDRYGDRGARACLVFTGFADIRVRGFRHVTWEKA